MADDDPAPTPEQRVGPTWEVAGQVLQVVAAGAALVGWIAVIGAARVRIRFDQAGLPSPLDAVSVVPRDTLVAEGLDLLAVPLCLASVVAMIAYLLLRRSEREREDAARILERHFGERYRGLSSSAFPDPSTPFGKYVEWQRGKRDDAMNQLTLTEAMDRAQRKPWWNDAANSFCSAEGASPDGPSRRLLVRSSWSSRAC